MPGLQIKPSMKAAAVAIALLVHAGGLAAAARSFGSVAQVDGGDGPVINLTLERARHFDSKPMSRSEISPSEARPEPAPTELRPRQPVSPVLPAEVLEIQEPTRDLASPPLQPAPLIRTMADGRPAPIRPQGRPSQAVGTTSSNVATPTGVAARHQEDAYATAVIAWVERHKGRPRDLLKGAVTLRFELDRQGRLRRAEIVQQAEDSRVGARALDALRAAPPFPRPPVGTAWTRREFTVRLDYRPTALP